MGVSFCQYSKIKCYKNSYIYYIRTCIIIRQSFSIQALTVHQCISEEWRNFLTLFYIPRSRTGNIVISMSGCQTVRPRFVAAYLDNHLYCIHTFLRGCMCAFWWLWPLPWFFTFDFEAIIDFNWWRIKSNVSGRYLKKRLLDCFYIAHTHSPGCVLGVMTFDLIFYLRFWGHHWH